MPSIRYINQSAPFWDFVANLENEGVNHPFLNGGRAQESEREGEGVEGNQPAWGWGPFAYRPHPHPHHGPGPHGHRGPPHHRHGRRGGPPQQPGEGEDVPPPPFEEKEGSAAPFQEEKGEPSGKHANGEESASDGPEGQRRRGPGGFGRRGHCGGKRGGPGFARGPWGKGFPFGGHFGGIFNENRDSGDEDFKPDVDVFDTETAYVVHLSLPGAKKEDISVTWDAEKSEVAIAGVVHRPGDEEFLKTLAMDERKVGAFERKIRLGTLANPAQVDADGINAKLEDGILRVDIPKQDKDYVEVKMVDIE